MSNRRRELLALGAAMAPLLPALTVGFLLDDFVALVHARDGGWSWVLGMFAPSGEEFLRPLAYPVFHLEGLVTGWSPVAMHAVHLGLFGVAAWLAGRLAIRLGAKPPASWAAVFALLYPGRHETYTWLAALFDLLALILVTAGLLAALRARERDGPRPLLPVAALAALAPLAKEVGFVVPLAVATWEAAGVLPPARRSRRVAVVAAASAGAALAVAYRFAALGGVGGYAGTSVGGAVERLAVVPRVLWNMAAIPVNPAYGWLSTAVGAACVVAFTASLAASARRGGRDAIRLAAAGGSLALLGLLPALPYLAADVVHHHSRYLSIAGLGVALAASAVPSAGGRLARAGAGLLVAAWAGATMLNLQPWREAARGRDAILGGIEAATREQGEHVVWVAGEINEWRGAHVLGGDLGYALEWELPERRIAADSEFFQAYQGRPVLPPEIGPGARLHLFRYDPFPPRLETLGGLPGGR